MPHLWLLFSVNGRASLSYIVMKWATLLIRRCANYHDVNMSINQGLTIKIIMCECNNCCQQLRFSSWTKSWSVSRIRHLTVRAVLKNNVQAIDIRSTNLAPLCDTADLHASNSQENQDEMNIQKVDLETESPKEKTGGLHYGKWTNGYNYRMLCLSSTVVQLCLIHIDKVALSNNKMHADLRSIPQP